MALRVLLADESTTIKKVMQLALQDYAVEVKAVPIGLDVIPVAQGFRPDIVFADILLQKKTGYDVARELKNHPELKTIPIVLMWSGFMEIDEAKFIGSGADQKLEKPFDAETLRSLVQRLVQKTQSNPVSSYLRFPPLPDFEEESASAKQTPSLPTVIKEITPSSISFQPSTRIEPPKTESPKELDIFQIPEVGEDENWNHQPLHHQTHESGDFEEITFVQHDLNNTQSMPTQISMEVRPDELNLISTQHAPPASQFVIADTPALMPQPAFPAAQVQNSALDEVLAERVLREEAQKIIEKVAWQILPDLCERLVKEELNKLLKDAEKNI